MQREFLEITKEATSQFVSSLPKVDPLNIRLDQRKGDNTLKNYMGALKQKTTDPTVGGLAQTQLDSLNYITKRNPSLKSSLRVDNRRANLGRAHINFSPREGNTTVASRSRNPLVFGHEVAHADDYANRKGFNVRNPNTADPRRQTINRLTTVANSIDRAQDKARQGETYADSLRRKVGPTYLGRKMGVDYKVLPYGTLQEPEGSDDLMFKKIRQMQRAGGRRDLIVDEVQANRKTLESYAPWRNRNRVPMTPEQRRVAAEILANQTTYYESTPKFKRVSDAPNSLAVPTGQAQRTKTSRKQLMSTPAKSKVLRIEQMEKDTKRRISELDALIRKADEVGATTAGNDLKRRRRNLIQNRLPRLTQLKEEVIENRSPFRGARFGGAGSWETMTNAQRRSYIQQILKNEKRLASDFGQDAGKLYKSEMMRALRKTLRR